MTSDEYKLLEKRMDEGFKGINSRLDKINGSVKDTLEKHNNCRLETTIELTKHDERIHDLEEKPSTTKLLTIVTIILGAFISISTYIIKVG